MKSAAFLLLLCFTVAPGMAGGTASAAPQDKSEFTLFHPTPAELMREMNPDRPDTTESPYTVDAGHVQAEATFFSYTRDAGVDGYSIGETNFKLGLTNHTDLQLVVPFCEWQRGGGQDDSGTGDLTVRWKWNLWGDDGGDTAFGVMPFVKVPAASHDLGNDKVEGGLIFPLTVNLSERAGVSMMAEFDVAHDEVRGGYGVDFVNSVSFGLNWTEKLGSYFEFASVASTRAGESWQGHANTGFTFAVTDNVVLDAGITVGIVSAAEDFGTFAGVSMRF